MSKENIIENLRELVKEWVLATDGDLNVAKANVDLILTDVCNSLNINPSEVGL